MLKCRIAGIFRHSFLRIRRLPRSTPFLHDALPIFPAEHLPAVAHHGDPLAQREDLLQPVRDEQDGGADRKSTRLNSSHTVISYAVFCLKKQKYADSQPSEEADRL